MELKNLQAVVVRPIYKQQDTLAKNLIKCFLMLMTFLTHLNFGMKNLFIQEKDIHSKQLLLVVQLPLTLNLHREPEEKITAYQDRT